MKGFDRVFNKKRIFSVMPYVLLAFGVIILILAFIPEKDPHAKTSGDAVVIRDADSGDEAVNETVSSVMPGIGMTAADFAPVSKSFVLNGNASVVMLIRNYCEALIKGDDELLAKYTDSVAGIDPVIKKVYAENVEEIIDMECYIMDGMLDNTFITVTTYDVRYKDQDTLLPYIMYCYVCTDASGNLYVSNKEQGEDVSSYNDMMYRGGFISDIVSDVASEYDRNLADDSKLAEYVSGFSYE